ncbi:MAG: hypothetical protein PVF47_09995 [Anaerolineae bacterium]|jgi:GGDEF domain-containing protein
MNRIRLLVVLLIFWLFFFFSIERPLNMIDICRVAYIFAALMAIVAILLPRWRRVPLGVLLVVPIPIFLMLKAWEGDQVWGVGLPLTVTEVCGIAISTILASWVSNAVDEFERAVAHITLGPIGIPVESESTGQVEMYRELRRARHHQRPLSLIAIGIEEESVQIALDRMVQEAQQAMIKQYVLSDLARTLCNELEDYNLITQGNGHFLVLLPEVTPEQLESVIGRLRRTVSEQVGVTLKIGAASFPQNAVTFESLVEAAVGQIKEERRVSPQGQAIQAQSQPIAH